MFYLRLGHPHLYCCVPIVQLWCSGGQRRMGPATPYDLWGALQLRTRRISTPVHRLQRQGWQGQEVRVSCHSSVMVLQKALRFQVLRCVRRERSDAEYSDSRVVRFLSMPPAVLVAFARLSFELRFPSATSFLHGTQEFFDSCLVTC